MKFIYNNKEYKIEIIRKNNKNTYIRIKNNKIVITTNYFTTTNHLKKLIKENYNSISKMIDKTKKRQIDPDKFQLLDKIYNLKYNSSLEKISIKENTIYLKDDKMLNTWLDEFIKETFSEHLENCYNMFNESIPKPILKLRTMKSRWGVCNTKTHTITLNKELIKYSFDCLDYVCIHELSHLLEANHSKSFWTIVEKYCPNYKEIRKKLRNN